VIREKARRKADRESAEHAERSKLLIYQDDPVGFVENHMLGFVWSKQKAILESVRDNRLTAVPSAHDQGKSFIAAQAACWWIASHPPGEAFVVTMAPTGEQVEAILWREMGKLHAAGRLPGEMLTTKWKLDLPNGKQELVAFGRSPKDNDPTGAQGIHAKYVLVIFDEACGMSRPLWDGASSLAANDFSRFLAIGNPDDAATEFADVCKPGSGWNVIHISAFDSPNFTNEPVPDFLRHLLVGKVWVEERRKRWGEGSARWMSKVEGKFPEQAKDGLIKLSDITEAVNRELAPSLPHELGVDVGRGKGGDNSVVYLRRGPVARRKFRSRLSEPMPFVGEIMRLLGTDPDCRGVTKIKVDDAGVGGGITSRLQELKAHGDRDEQALLYNIEIVGVNVGEAAPLEVEMRKSDDPAARFQATERFENLKAQINWGIRERFQDGDIDIEDDDELQEQAGDIRYQTTSRGLIAIEKKRDAAKRRTGRMSPSPDDWDALVLAYADVANELAIWQKLGSMA
jgi:hypothetical protein